MRKTKYWVLKTVYTQYIVQTLLNRHLWLTENFMKERQVFSKVIYMLEIITQKSKIILQ